MKSPKKPPITITATFGPITKETIEALPEHVRRRLAALVFGFLAELAEKDEQSVAKMAA